MLTKQKLYQRMLSFALILEISVLLHASKSLDHCNANLIKIL